jgi:hypothetical protein
MGPRAAAAVAAILLLFVYCATAARISGSEGGIRDVMPDQQTNPAGSDTKKPNFVFILVRIFCTMFAAYQAHSELD